jgi:hypothetical protein
MGQRQCLEDARKRGSRRCMREHRGRCRWRREQPWGLQQRQQQSPISSSGLTIASQILILSSASLRGPSVIRRGTRHTHDSTSSRPTWDEKRSRACLTSSQQCSEQTCRNSPPQNYNPTACDMHAVSSNSSFPWIYRRIRTQTTCEHAQTHQHLSTSPPCRSLPM